MFPIIDKNLIATAEQQEAPQKMGASFLFDFDKGDFITVDGKLIKANGLDALKVWIEKVLRTEKSKFEVYKSADYGIRLSDLTMCNYPYSFVKSEIEREVREALEKNLEIQGVSSFEFERIKHGLHCTFTVNTIYGDIESEVTA